MIFILLQCFYIGSRGLHMAIFQMANPHKPNTSAYRNCALIVESYLAVVGSITTGFLTKSIGLAPSLRHHYNEFNTTTNDSVAVRCIDTLTLRGCPALMGNHFLSCRCKDHLPKYQLRQEPRVLPVVAACQSNKGE